MFRPSPIGEDHRGGRRPARWRLKALIGVTALGVIGVTVLPAHQAGAAGASAPGVTPTTITIGQIADVSEPVPGLFKSAVDGLQGYVDYINSIGGVDGRKLVLDSHDTAFSAANVVSETTEIAKNDLAMVGSYTVLDAAAQPVIDADHLPYIGTTISLPLGDDPNVYNPAPSTDYDYDLGPLLYLKQKYPQAIKHVGYLYPAALASTVDGFKAASAAMAHLGFKIIYARGYGVEESTFLADVIKMKAAGVQMFFGGVPDNYAATIAREFADENFNPIDIEPASYGTDLVPLAGSTANGMLLPTQQALFLGEDAKLIPEVGLFDKWIHKVDPKFGVASWGAAGWAAGMLFVQALKNAGHNPTRASLVAALNKITSFDAGGMIAPSNPAQNVPSPCWMLAEVVNQKIQRVSPPDPTNGNYVCNPGGLYPLNGFKPMNR